MSTSTVASVFDLRWREQFNAGDRSEDEASGDQVEFCVRGSQIRAAHCSVVGRGAWLPVIHVCNIGDV